MNDITYFVGELQKFPHKYVATIGGQDSQPSGMGLVPVCVVDDKSNISVMRLENDLHFPESPFNIISIACLADRYNDDDGTFIKKSRFFSEFSWDFAKSIKTIHYTDRRILEIEVSKPSSAWKALASISRWYTGPSVLRVFHGNADNNKPTLPFFLTMNLWMTPRCQI